MIPAERHDQLRHVWHRRVLRASAMMTLLLLVVAVLVTAGLVLGVLRAGQLGGGAHGLLAGSVLLFVAGPSILVLGRGANTARPRAEGTVVGPGQYPRVHAIAAEMARATGLERPPLIVVRPGAPELAASSARFGRHVVVLHPDLLEASRPDGEPGALRFALAREFGLLASGERDFGGEFLTMVTQGTPYVARLLTRAEAYTADRWAAVLAPGCAAEYFGVLASSKQLWPEVNPRRLAASAGESWTETLISFVMPTPPVPWRVRGLAPLGVFRPDAGEADPGELLERAAGLDAVQRFWHRPPRLRGEELDRWCPDVTVGELIAGW